MKKFNFFAIAAIALTSVFGFTSCDKDDDINHALNTPTMTQVQGTQVQGTQAQGDQGLLSQGQETQVQKEGTSESKQIINTNDALSKMRNFDFIGSWEYTNEDGKTFVLNVTEETDTNSTYHNFAATVTIDGEEYEGEMTTAVFKTIAKSTDNKSRLCGLAFLDYADKSAGDELAVRVTYDKNTYTKPAIFKKVSGTQNEVRRRLSVMR